jgi:hypothetical protein
VSLVLQALNFATDDVQFSCDGIITWDKPFYALSNPNAGLPAMNPISVD